MLQDLAALTPPVIVCVAVLLGTWAIVRRELAPKRRQRAEATVAADEDQAVDPERDRSLYPDIGDLSSRTDRRGFPRRTHLRVAEEVRSVRLRR
jgi:hypothetical protein